MSKRAKRGIIIASAVVAAMIAAAVIFLLVKGKSSGYRSISIAEIVGKVVTKNDGKTYEAYKNMRLADGYELTTDAESYTRLVLDDDKYVKLEQNSHAVFEALGDAKKHLTTIRLEKGALTTEITKPLTESESYVVNTPNAVLAVRGTMFRIEVKQDENDDYYCDVYTYGGVVEAHRIMPDGTHVDERVEIRAGYKATIKMDEVITVYLEEKIDEQEKKDNVDPIYVPEIIDSALVDVYNSSYNGHDMFITTAGLWDEIVRRGIDLSQYRSMYDGGAIPEMPEKTNESSIISSYESSVSSEIIVPEPPISSSTSSEETRLPISVPSSSNTTTMTGSSSSSSSSTSSASSSRPVSTSSSSSSTRPASSSSSTSTASSTSQTPEPPIIEHTHTLTTTTTEPTCTQSGSKLVKCAECGEIISEETLPPRGHSSVTETITPATCTDEGEELDKCSVCGGQLGRRTLPPLGHTIDDPEIKTEPSTCTEHGKEESFCRRCGALLGARELPLTEHSEVSETEGDITTVRCEVCGEIIRQTNNATGVVYPVALDEEHFPDEEFRWYVSEYIDTDGDGVLTLEECEAITSIDLRNQVTVNSLEGIEYFAKLETLYCSKSGLTTLDVSKNTALTYLDCSRTQIAELDVSKNTALTYLNCSETQITELDVSKNLTLVSLRCSDTQLKSLDVSKNKELSALACSNTQITSLDTSNNTALRSLVCRNTQITFIDISNNVELLELGCDNTQITSLDVSKNTALMYLICSNTQIAFIDISNNPIPESEFESYNCKHPIHVVDGVFDLNSIDGFDFTKVSELTGAIMDEHGVLSGIAEGVNITYTYDCGQGRSATFTLVPDETSTFAPEPEGVAIDEENFPDEVFRAYISANFDTDGDGELSQEECDAVTIIDVSGTSSTDDGGITSLKGVENFTKLKGLNCRYNNGLTELDVSGNTGLSSLVCYNTQIASLDVSENTELTEVICAYTSITSLDLSNNVALESFRCEGCSITSLDLSKNVALTFLTCQDTQITVLDVSKNTALKSLNCYNTQITSLDVSKNTALKSLDCRRTKIASLDVSKNTALVFLGCAETRIIELDLSANMELATLYCYNTSIKELDLSANTALKTLWCVNCFELKTLDVSKNTSLTDLQCNSPQITSLDVSNNTALTWLSCHNTQITSLDVSKNTALTYLDCSNTKIAYVDVSNNPNLNTFISDGCEHPIHVENGLFDLKSIDGFDINRIVDGTLTGASLDENGVLSGITEGTNITYVYDCKGNGDSAYQIEFTLVPDETSTFAPETPDGIAINSDNFPDEAFRQYISDNVDTDSNGYLSYDEDAFVTELDLSDLDIGSLAGIESFSYLNRVSFKVHIENGEFDISNIDVIDQDNISALPAINATLTGTVLGNIHEGETVGFLWHHDFGTENNTYFMLVPDDTSTFAPESRIAELSANDGGNTPPDSPAPPHEDAAEPPSGFDGMAFLPLGILALIRDRKRNTAFCAQRKAEI